MFKIQDAKHYDIDQIILFLKNNTNYPIVIAIDEFPSISINSNNKKELPHLINFINKLLSLKNIFVIFIGPEASCYFLPEPIEKLLRKSERINTRNLYEYESGNLLKASNQKNRYNIEIEDLLVQIIYDYTDGNPYWLNLIGSEMWQFAREKTTEVTKYSRAIYKQAIREVLKMKLPFMDRIYLNSDISKHIILFLLKNENPPTGKIAEHICHTCDIKNLEIVDKELDILESNGTILRNTKNDKSCWKLHPPILKKHIKSYSKRLIWVRK